MANTQENKNGINIELSEEIAQGSYVNLAIIGHSNSEFILDFIRVMPGTPKAKVTNRLVMTPEHAKRLLTTLEENIDKYEAQFGEIRINTQPTNNIPMGFGPNGAKA